MNRIGGPDFENEVKLLCYLRERRRIVDLANILEKREIIRTQKQSEQALSQLKEECWEMVKNTRPNVSPGLLLSDGVDMLQFDFINGDVIR